MANENDDEARLLARLLHAWYLLEAEGQEHVRHDGLPKHELDRQRRGFAACLLNAARQRSKAKRMEALHTIDTEDFSPYILLNRVRAVHDWMKSPKEFMTEERAKSTLGIESLPEFDLAEMGKSLTKKKLRSGPLTRALLYVHRHQKPKIALSLTGLRDRYKKERGSTKGYAWEEEA